MGEFLIKFKDNLKNRKSGMELVQDAILNAIAIALGLLFRQQIGNFVKDVFGSLQGDDFYTTY